MKRNIFFIGFLAVLFAATLVAHDFWLIPNKFRVQPNEPITIFANTGMDFPDSLSAVDPERVAQFLMKGRFGEKDITEYEVKDNSLITESVFEQPGTHILAMALKPKEIKLTAEEFNEYVLHDGLPEIYDLRKKEGILDKDAVEYYSKYPKTIIQIGERLDNSILEPIGLDLEIIPLENPYSLKIGDDLPVKVLFKDEPLENAEVAWSYPGRGEEFAGSTKTDSNGKAVIPLEKAGPYIIRAIQMEWVKKDTHEWESYWASLTFEVLPGSFPNLH